jgi:hypothetical protein
MILLGHREWAMEVKTSGETTEKFGMRITWQFISGL